VIGAENLVSFIQAISHSHSLLKVSLSVCIKASELAEAEVAVNEMLKANFSKEIEATLRDVDSLTEEGEHKLLKSFSSTEYILSPL